MEIGYCKFCGNQKPLIKAHIIPKQLFQIPSGKNQLIMVNADTPYTARCLEGVTDNRILCADCDLAIGQYDQEAQTLLLSNLSEYKSKDKDYYEIPWVKFDYKKIKLFFISLIWRASISSMPFYKGVDLGDKYENVALDILKNLNQERVDFFPIFLWKYKNIESLPVERIVLEPIHFRLCNRNCYRFVFAGYLVNIKVDKQELPSVFSRLYLNPNNPLIMLEPSPEQETTMYSDITKIHNRHYRTKMEF